MKAKVLMLALAACVLMLTSGFSHDVVAGSKENKADCEKWCKANSETEGCVKCDKGNLCDVGKRALKRWGQGWGKGWGLQRKCR